MNRTRSLLLLLPFCTACYTYAPVELANVTPGTMVRARIAADQMARVEPLVGRSTRVLDGVLVDAGADSLLIEVPAATRTTTGGGIQVLNQRLSIPRTGVTEVELKRLSRGRTIGLIAVGTAALGLHHRRMHSTSAPEKKACRTMEAGKTSAFRFSAGDIEGLLWLPLFHHGGHGVTKPRRFVALETRRVH